MKVWREPTHKRVVKMTMEARGLADELWMTLYVDYLCNNKPGCLVIQNGNGEDVVRCPKILKGEG